MDTSDTSYIVVLYAFYALLTVNFVGTLYDFVTDGNTQRKFISILDFYPEYANLKLGSSR